jgi:hypothetical protein
MAGLAGRDAASWRVKQTADEEGNPMPDERSRDTARVMVSA